MSITHQEQALSKLQQVKAELHKGIVGQDDFIEHILIGILSNGHLLIESVPGLAKTRAINLLASICDVKFKRIQFTPDLLPADIVGTRIFNQESRNFEIKHGPVFANFILADEINRAPAKVQSALLETMQEHQVTIGKNTIPVPLPFFVFATQNPVEQEGTYPLPEAQLDRFLMKLVLDYPTPEQEAEIVEMVVHETEMPKVKKIMSPEEILAIQGLLNEVHVERKITEYIVKIVNATRDIHGIEPLWKEAVELGGSPRASIYLAKTAKAKAFLDGRQEVYPDDVKAVALPVLRHRIKISYYGLAEGISGEDIIRRILAEIPAP